MRIEVTNKTQAQIDRDVDPERFDRMLKRYGGIIFLRYKRLNA